MTARARSCRRLGETTSGMPQAAMAAPGEADERSRGQRGLAERVRERDEARDGKLQRPGARSHEARLGRDEGERGERTHGRFRAALANVACDSLGAASLCDRVGNPALPSSSTAGLVARKYDSSMRSTFSSFTRLLAFGVIGAAFRRCGGYFAPQLGERL